MGLDTWKQRYYTEPADSGSATSSAKVALDHSIRKWEGMFAGTLEAHGLRTINDGRGIFNTDGTPGYLRIGAESCALCAMFFTAFADHPCGTCPLAESRGGVACDKETNVERESPWGAWLYKADPKPMLEALRGCAVWLEEQGQS